MEYHASGQKMPISKNSLEAFLKTGSRKDAAIHFEVSLRTISRLIHKYQLFRKTLYPSGLTDPQNDLMTACLLGDGGIHSSRFQFGQNLSRIEYTKWMFDQFLPFSKKIVEGRFYTTRHTIFEDLRKEWYNDKQKTIPKTLVLNETIFCHWFLQDGTNNQPKRSIRIATQSFTKLDVEFLLERLWSELGIKGSLNWQKGLPTIHIGSYDYEKAINLVAPMVSWKCFTYKTKMSKKQKPKLNRLDQQTADKIRLDFKSGISVKDISLKYETSQSTIYNIINNLTYKVKKDVAEVYVVYNPIKL
jgi:predicted DNA-binding protein (UPF0251 family)